MVKMYLFTLSEAEPSRDSNLMLECWKLGRAIAWAIPIR
jgi:hypothetical protein